MFPICEKNYDSFDKVLVREKNEIMLSGQSTATKQKYLVLAVEASLNTNIRLRERDSRAG